MAAHVSEDIWRGRYDRWKASGLPLHEFGAKENVSAKSLPCWKRRMMQFERDSGASMTFVRVAEDEPNATAATTDVELVLPNAVRVRVPCGTPGQQLIALVTALGMDTGGSALVARGGQRLLALEARRDRERHAT